MQEKIYIIIRKVSFWVFTLLFIILTPTILFYSLGYKFNVQTQKFVKTGTISIVTHPEGAKVNLDNRNLEKTTPCILAELTPKIYTLLLEKDGYYTYKKTVELKPSFVSEIDVILVPQIQDMQKIELDFNIYRFFLVKHILAERIFVFSNQGIFSLDKDFKNIQKVSAYDIDAHNASKLKGLIDVATKLVFWDTDNIFTVDILMTSENKDNQPVAIYSAKRFLKNVFFGIKDQYLIIQDGLEVLVLDLKNKEAIFSVTKLKNSASEIVYDSSSDTLYVKEKIPQTDSFSLFKLDFFPSIIKRLSNEKNF